MKHLINSLVEVFIGCVIALLLVDPENSVEFFMIAMIMAIYIRVGRHD